MIRVHVLLSGVLISLAGSASAAGGLGPEGSPFSTSDYALDLQQGPVLAGNRVTGLAGAYSPIADGAEGDLFNPASPAVRAPWSTTKFDWDVNLGVTFPSTFLKIDFFNRGSIGFSQKDFIFLTLGGNLQYGPAGLGLAITSQQYNLTAATGGVAELSLVQPKLQLGWAFLQDQLVFGLGMRGVNVTLHDRATNRDLFNVFGAGLEFGAVVAPRALPFRTSLVIRPQVSAGALSDASGAPDANGDTIVGGRYLPRAVVLPAEVEIGIAWQFGARPLNLGWTDRASLTDEEIDAARSKEPNAKLEDASAIGERILVQRYRHLPRQKLLLVASLLYMAPVQRAVGFESILLQTIQRSGAVGTFTPRLGVEAEPWEGRLQVRAGSYVEPTRFDTSSARVHGTFGLDFKAFEWDVFGIFADGTGWRMGGSIDGARDYFSWGLSVGVWH